MTVVEAREIERKTVEAVRAADPSRTERPMLPDPDLVMGRIGVTYLSPERANGYIRLYPQDFLVEEITSQGQIVRLDLRSDFEDSEDKRTLWADLIKVQMSGPNALQEVQHMLKLDETKVAAAGIKDAVAVTAQRLSLRGVTREQVLAASHPQMILRPVSYGSGALQLGALQGNRFTIVIRGDVEASRALIHRTFSHIQANGFLNFYGPQRFGSRLNVHHLGRRLLQGDVQGALRAFFGEPGPYDVPLFRELRQDLDAAYGDWDRMLALCEHFPFTLRDEAKVLQALKQDDRKTRQALAQIKEQVRLWVYAYGSWLVNRAISQAVSTGQTLPSQLPMPFHPNGPLPLYKEFMEADKTSDFVNVLANYPYINMSDKTIPTVMMPKGLEAKEIPEGWIVRFELGKGAYATSLMSHLIRMYEGLPIPDWAPQTPVDALKVYGEGSIEDLRPAFAPYLVRRDLMGQTTTEAPVE